MFVIEPSSAKEKPSFPPLAPYEYEMIRDPTVSSSETVSW